MKSSKDRKITTKTFEIKNIKSKKQNNAEKNKYKKRR